MSEQQIEHAFDRFWRGRTGGTRLGLTIVREFVELNDGNVQLRNGQPSGLVVDLALKANQR